MKKISDGYPKWLTRLRQHGSDGYQFKATLHSRSHTCYFGAVAHGGIRKAKAAAEKYRRAWIRLHGDAWKRSLARTHTRRAA